MAEVTLTDVFVAEAEARAKFVDPDICFECGSGSHCNCAANALDDFCKAGSSPQRSLTEQVHELASIPNPNNIDELREALNHIYEITKP